MYSKSKLIIFLIITLFFIFPQNVMAVSITVSNYPTSISSEIFTVDAMVTGATNATNYLRVDLYKDGTTNYFGETYNGSDWYSGSEGKNYFPILIQNSSASATLQVQIGNPNISDYSGQGLYKLKVRRYTSSGSQSQNDVQSPVDIQITYSTPSPSPTESPTNPPTTTPTNPPTASPTKSPSPVPTKSSSPKPTATSTPTQFEQPEELVTTGLSFGKETTPEPTGTVLGSSKEKKKSPVLAIILITLGFGFLGYVGYLIYNMRNAKGKETN